VLLVRQAIGKSIYEEFGPTQADELASNIDYLEQLLTNLLPELYPLRSQLEPILEAAVKIANMMTQDQAWFRCVAYSAGDPLDENVMDVEDEAQKGRVFICTFPSFRKITRNEDDGSPESECLTKACVELESILG